MASVSGWVYAVVYIIAFIVGALIGFFLDFEGSRWESALIYGFVIGAAAYVTMDWGVRLFSSVSDDGWTWLYWSLLLWVAISLVITGGLIAFKHHT